MGNELTVNPSSLIEMAIKEKCDVAQLKALFDLQLLYEANEAKKAFVAAMAAFAADPPKLEKTKQVEFKTRTGVTGYRHADLNEVVEKTTPKLSACKLSAAWKYAQDNGIVTVTCQVTHIDGHMEETSLSGPYDNSGGKNHIQGIVSTTTYLRRATYLARLGLTAGDIDDDGSEAMQEPVQQSAQRVEALTRDHIDAIDKIVQGHYKQNSPDAYKWLRSPYGVDNMGDIPDVEFGVIMQKIYTAIDLDNLAKGTQPQ